MSHRRRRFTGRLLAAVAMLLPLFTVPAPGAAAAAPEIVWHQATKPDPFRGWVTSVDCVTTHWCMAVDYSGRAVRYSNGTWTRFHVKQTSGMSGFTKVSCGSTRSCLAVDGDGAVAHYDGRAWSRPASLGHRVHIETVSCPTATFCLALGSHTALWNGVRWRLSHSPLLAGYSGTPQLSCSSAGFCVATEVRGSAGAQTTFLWTHRSWHRSGTLHVGWGPISCTSSRFCMVIGSRRYARWDGARWHVRDTDIVTNALPGAISCTNRYHCLAAGTYRHPESIEWDGSHWRRDLTFDRSPRRELADVSCAGRHLACVAFDITGGTSWYRGHRWHWAGGHDPAWGLISNVACTSTTCLLTDDAGGYVATRGSGWTRPARSVVHPGFGNGVGSISCTRGGVCLELTEGLTARRFDGHGWHSVAAPPFTGPLSCVSANWCAVMDPYVGRVSVFDGTRWHKPVGSFRNEDEPFDFACASRTACIASGVGLLRVWNGRRWVSTKRVGPKYSSSQGVSCAGPHFCMALGAWGASWRFDGTAWHKVDGLPGGEAISCTSASFCTVVGDGVWLYDGHAWTKSTSLDQPANLPYQEIGCASPALCVVSSPADPVIVGTAA
jgi:hypothetical protein